MRKALLVASAMLGLAAAPAMAAPIVGTFNISGAGTCSTSACTFTDSTPLLPGNALIGAVSGSYVTAGFSVGSGATINNFTYNPFTSGTVYTALNLLNIAGKQARFDVTSQVSATYSPVLGVGSTVSIIDLGIAYLTGYDPTPGIWTFTQNQFGQATGTFSASSIAVAVPEPASMALFGVGLLGLAMVRRSRSRGV